MKIKLTTYEPPADFPACCIGDFHTIEHYDENGKMTGKSYYGISEEGANTYAVKAVYIDDDAKRFLWRNYPDLFAELKKIEKDSRCLMLKRHSLAEYEKRFALGYIPPVRNSKRTQQTSIFDILEDNA